MSSRTGQESNGSELTSARQLNLNDFCSFSTSSDSHDWFELIQPKIRHAEGETSGEELCRVGQIHARQVLSRTELKVDLSKVVWKADPALSSCHGYCSWIDGWHVITLSMLSLQHNGWEQTMTTVRHELVHAWQREQGILDEPNNIDPHDHSSFEQWMDALSIAKTGPEVTDSRYVIVCESCSRINTYPGLCEDIRTVVNNESECGICGADSDPMQVYDINQGISVKSEDLPPEPVLSLQFQIQMQNRDITTSRLNLTGELPRRLRKLYHGTLSRVVDDRD